MGKVCKTHKHWPKHGKHDQSWVQFNAKMSLRHYVKHLTCNRVHNLWKMHEYNEKLPRYMLNLPYGANIRTIIANGAQPNQNFGKFFTNLRTPTHFQKIPKILEP